MATSVEPIRSRRERRLFRDLPERLFGNDPAFVPPLRHAFDALLNRRRNPYWKHAEAQEWLAWRDGECVGRIGACFDRQLTARAPGTGSVGFFESVDDAAVARALFETAEGWLGGHGLDRARGPLNYSVHDTAGLLVDGFDTPPTVDTTWNPPFYVGLWEGHGWEGATDLLGTAGPVRKGGSDRVRRVADMAKKRGVVARPLDFSRFKEEMGRLLDIYNAAWDENWGHVPISREEFFFKASDMKAIVDRKTVWLAEKDGKTIAFLLTLPDLNVAIKKSRGRLLPFGWWRLLQAKRGGRLRVVLMGVLPGHRVRGVEVLLLNACYGGMGDRYDWAEASWVLESNKTLLNGLEEHSLLPYKRWRLYEKRIRASGNKPDPEGV
ncbi:MAG: hypothetical protein O7E54_13265 [Planctomycetota bacterium]|nr:hypothetical protein [Planctomycetota bacterium]